MVDFKEFKVGEKIILEVEETEDVTCKGCFFCGTDMHDHCFLLCINQNSSIGTHIIFREVKEESVWHRNI